MSELERIKSFIDRLTKNIEVLKNEAIEYIKILNKKTYKHPLKGKEILNRIKYSK